MQSNVMPEKSPTLTFCLLVFLLSLPFWLLGALAAHWAELLPVNLPVSALMAVCPLLAAMILAYREAKGAGVKRLLKRVFDHRRIKHKIWYVPIIFTMPAIALLAYAAMRMMGLPLPDPFMPWLAIPIFFVAYFVSAATEELGWLPYFVDPLQGRWGALLTNVVMGLVWGIWHSVPYIQAHNPLGWIVWQSIFSVAARVLIGWLYNNTEQSVFAAVLFHTMINVCWSAFPNYGSHYNPAVTGTITVIAALLVTLLWGPKRLVRDRYA